MTGPAARRWLAGGLGAEVSTRTLALLRIAVATTVVLQFMKPWVSHEMDRELGLLLAAWAVLGGALLVGVGLATRFASAAMALGFAVVHFYYGYRSAGGDPELVAPVQVVQVAALLALTPCGRSLSIDRVREVRRARREHRPPTPERMPAWVLELFVIQTSAVYLWGAYDMLDPAWLSGARLELIWLDLYGSSDAYVVHPRLPTAARALAWFAALSTIAIGVGLLIRPIRTWVAGYALVVQCAVLWIYSLDWDGAYFNLMMINLLIACLPPDPVARGFTAVVKGPAAAAAEATAEPGRVWRSLPAWLGPAALALALTSAHLGPYRAQARGEPVGPGVWDWKLHDPPRYPRFVVLRYYDMSRGGALIERWALLGHASPDDLAPDLRRIGRKQLAGDQRRVCAALRERGDAEPVVELDARLTGGREFRRLAARETNVCAPEVGP